MCVRYQQGTRARPRTPLKSHPTRAALPMPTPAAVPALAGRGRSAHLQCGCTGSSLPPPPAGMGRSPPGDPHPLPPASGPRQTTGGSRDAGQQQQAYFTTLVATAGSLHHDGSNGGLMRRLFHHDGSSGRLISARPKAARATAAWTKRIWWHLVASCQLGSCGAGSPHLRACHSAQHPMHQLTWSRCKQGPCARTSSALATSYTCSSCLQHKAQTDAASSALATACAQRMCPTTTSAGHRPGRQAAKRAAAPGCASTHALV